jgi:xanthine dehydrogenase molybdenum-binding subunit
MATTETAPSSYKVIGKRPIRPDGVEKVTGRAVYGADVHLAGLVHGIVLRSPHAHAMIKRIDASMAKAFPGVLAVITGENMPVAASTVRELGEQATNIRHASNKLLAHHKVLYKGHPVAAVAALDSNTAQEAAKLIQVEYEVLSPVLTVDEALSFGASILHDDLIGDHLGEKKGHTNLARHFRHESGDVEQGFRDSTIVREGTYRMATVHQGYIEPQNATALWQNDGKLTIWTSTQGAFGVREALATVLRIPESKIRVVPCEIGGGFGGKLDIYLEPLAALLSQRCGRPVHMVMDRAAVFEATGPTPGAKVTVKLGVDSTGRILAGAAELLYEAGAYPGSPVGAGAMCIFAPYRIKNTRIDGYDVVVNKPKSAAYRAPGATQAAFGMESLVDEVCTSLEMDPLEFRLLNASHEGDRRADGPLFRLIGTSEVHQAAKESPHYQSLLTRQGPDGHRRGRGVATGFWFNGGMRSSVSMSVSAEGIVSLVEGSVDIGGSRASIAMQVAEVLGIPFEDVHPTMADTEGVGYNDQTGGSRTTNTTGYAAYLAAQEVIGKMSERAASIWDLKPEDVQFADGEFSATPNPVLRMSFKQLAARFNATGGPVNATGSMQQRGGAGAFGTHIVDVEVDTQTGKVDVLRYTAVQDAGKAIHPSYVEGQMQGGVVQGIGWALHEEYAMSTTGTMENASFLDYRIPTALDVPMIETIIVEVPNPDHPFGVRGVGEVPIVAPVAAVANAIHDALGVRFPHTPIKPSRILAALVGEHQRE